jgi:hypothetical protein
MPAATLSSPEATYVAATRTEASLNRSGQEAAVRIRQEMQKNTQAATSPMEAFRKSVEASKPLAPGAQRLIESNIGVTFDDTGAKDRDPEEMTRFSTANKGETLARDYLGEGGYDALNPAQQTELRRQAEDVLTLDPQMEAALPTNPAARERMIVDLLKQEGAITEIRARYNQVFSEQARLTNEATAAEAGYREAEAEETRLQREVTRNSNDLATTVAALDRFRPGATDARDLDRLNGQYSRLQEQLESEQELTNDLGRRIRNQEDRRDRTTDPAIIAQIETDILAKNGDRDTHRAEARRISRQMAKRDELQAEKARLEAEKQKLEEEAPKLAKQHQEALRKKLELQATRDLAIDARANSEQAFVDSINNIVGAGIAKYLEGQLEQADAVRIKLNNEDIAKTTDAIEKALKIEAATIYRKGKKFSTRYDGKSTDASMADLVSTDPTRGPDAVLRSMLTPVLQEEIRTGRLVLKPGETFDDVLKARMDDKEFVGRMRPVAIEALVAARVKTGRLTKEEATIIVNSDWGAGLIDRAKSLNSGTEQAIQQLREQGTISSDLMASLKKMEPGMVLKILLALFGGAVGFAITHH